MNNRQRVNHENAPFCRAACAENEQLGILFVKVTLREKFNVFAPVNVVPTVAILLKLACVAFSDY